MGCARGTRSPVVGWLVDAEAALRILNDGRLAIAAHSARNVFDQCAVDVLAFCGARHEAAFDGFVTELVGRAGFAVVQDVDGSIDDAAARFGRVALRDGRR